MKTLIIVGSARPDGNTWRVAQQLKSTIAGTVDLLELSDLTIHTFRYDQQYPADDNFQDFIEAKVLAYDSIVLASPVYWYSMSAQMKTFLDRFSDLLKSRKALGRQLRGKSLSILSCSGTPESWDCFYAPFRLSADYLGMQYAQEWHGWVDEASNQVQLIPYQSVA
jgi:multimeric flavodoxin WrbA